MDGNHSLTSCWWAKIFELIFHCLMALGDIMKKLIALLACAALLAGCSTTQSKFYEDPTAPQDTFLCRAYLDTDDVQYRADVAKELSRRGLTDQQCRDKVAGHTAALVGIALLGTALAVGAAASSGGGYSAPYYSGGGYGYAWDQFYNVSYRLIWRCRSRANGQFVPDSYCAGKAKSDFTWPGYSA
ncbi:hypothetical protein [Pelagibacterium mangrovi]|uniref:hypothetical protein n=1 Tax=Pelagibacterium mangrovi TaxID=3119828 RepID=UPI002FCAA662